MTKDIQRVVAVFVHRSVASVFGLNVAIAASAFAGNRLTRDCPSCVAAATMLTTSKPLAMKTAAATVPLAR